MNNILLVEITTTSQPVMATCSFLSGFTGHALCRVDFTGPDGVTYTSVSTERGSAGESVTVELRAALLPSTTYSYQATLEDPSDESMCVKGIGQFTTEEHNGDFHVQIHICYLFFILTDCNIKDLGTSASDSSECGEGEMAGDIPNGMLCYTGLTPGSTAAYSCDKGYELNGTSVLACLPSDQLMKENSIFQQQIADLQKGVLQDKAKLVDELEAIEADVMMKEDSYAQLTARNKQVEDVLQLRDKDMEDMNSKLAKAQVEIEELAGQLEQSHEDKIALGHKVESLKTEKEDLVTELARQVEEEQSRVSTAARFS